jgi:type I restriction enzyme, R subunit
VFGLIEQEVQTSGFWNSIPMQNRLRGELQSEVLLNHKSIFENLFNKRTEIISRLLEWARAHHSTIIR